MSKSTTVPKPDVEQLLENIDQQLLARLLESLVKEQSPLLDEEEKR